jgi:hypothetical protein
MTTFLFWNIRQKPLEAVIANLAHRQAVDVLMLAECAIAPGALLKTLNREGVAQFHLPDAAYRKLAVYTRFSRRYLVTVRHHPRYTIRRLKLPAYPDILLVVAHSPSKRNWTKESQAAECREMAAEIRSVEGQLGHTRTVLVGDLNMNPFEAGVVAANGLNAVMTRAIAQRRTRQVQSRRYPFFYNPMWGLFGDATAGPPGTYYYERSEHDLLFWNLFDQVLIRPDLFPYFRNEEVEILTGDGERSLLSAKGLPDTIAASDHLPILFKLNLARGGADANINS